MGISTNSLISHTVPQWQDSLVKPMSWIPGTERHTEGDGAEGGEKLPIDGGRIELYLGREISSLNTHRQKLLQKEEILFPTGV